MMPMMNPNMHSIMGMPMNPMMMGMGLPHPMMMGGMPMPMPMGPMGMGMMPMMMGMGNPPMMMGAGMPVPMMAPAKVSCEMEKDGMVMKMSPADPQLLPMMRERCEMMKSMMGSGAPVMVGAGGMPMMVCLPHAGGHMAAMGQVK
jgi:hypothetical protein